MEWLIYLLFLLVGFVLGRTGNKTTQDNANTLSEVKMPNLNPIKAYKEHQAKKEAEWEINKINTILENIENYDGTGKNQKDVPM